MGDHRNNLYFMIHYTDEQIKMAVKLRRKGLLLKEICKITGINQCATVSKVCKEAGLPIKKIGPRTIYQIGQRYHNFIIVKPTKSIMLDTGKHYTRWECKCDCGKLFEVTTKQIKRGQKSCGCHKFDSMFRRTLTDEQANIRKVLSHYKNSAKKRGLIWNLSEENSTYLLFSNCYYCGCSPNRICDYLKHCKSITVSGIDRKDNSIGYIMENCVSCCKICNRAKLNATKEEFENWAKNFITNFRGI